MFMVVTYVTYVIHDITLLMLSLYVQVSHVGYDESARADIYITNLHIYTCVIYRYVYTYYNTILILVYSVEVVNSSTLIN